MKRLLTLVLVVVVSVLAGFLGAPQAEADLECSDSAYRVHYDENGDSGCFGQGSDCAICFDVVDVPG